MIVEVATLITYVFVAPLLDGIRRKVYAVIQRRVGPPIIQTWLDIVKLFHRLPSSPANAPPLYWLGPIFAFALAVTALAIISIEPLSSFFGGIVAAVLLLEASLFASLVGVTGLSPYTSVGAARLWLVAACAEAGVLIPLVALHDKLGVVTINTLLLACAAILAGIVEFEQPPYNVAEAGPEIAAGPYTEYFGPLLATCIWASLLRGFTLIHLAYHNVLGLNPLVALVASAVTYIIYILLAAIAGRPRPGRAAGLAAVTLVFGLGAAFL